MYYNRTMDSKFAKLLEEKNELNWLLEFVFKNDDLDFLTGKSDSHKKGWISVYRGLSRILKITQYENGDLMFDANDAYKNISPKLYGRKKLEQSFNAEIRQLEALLEHVRDENNKRFNRYYDNRKEGFFQNKLSRDYALKATSESEFVIIDKEAIIGYKDISEKNEQFENIQIRYKALQKLVSKEDPERYGINLEKKALGGELDFIALDKKGQILLIEYKDSRNTSGIYLSPIQIGFYTELFSNLEGGLETPLLDMLKQKQEVGLISKAFSIPNKINGIVPILLISEYNEKSVAKDKFVEVMDIIKKKSDFGHSFLHNLEVKEYTVEGKITDLKWLV